MVGNGGDGGAGVLLSGGGTVTNSGSIAGGNGGAAGIAGPANTEGGNGGNGGAGGAGVLLSGSGTVTNSGSIAGGNGGAAGIAGPANTEGGNGGNGGAGGAGVLLSGSGTVTNSGSIAGGNGGAGGIAGSALGIGGNGGNGGSGGAGVSLSGSGVVTNSGSIAGGNAAAGANGGSAAVGGNGGNGGNGGAGVSLSAGGVVTNSGSIVGGNGAAGGLGGSGPRPGSGGTVGNGGVGVTGAGLTIVNSGTITGGIAGDGVTQVNAITFTGGANTLQLQAGSIINGNVVGTGNDAFQLGGSRSSNFNLGSFGGTQQYQGFATFGVVGGNWTLTGTNTTAVPFSVSNATATVDGTFNDSSATVNAGGILVVNGTLSDPTVNSGGTLTGTGTVGATQINAGGTFAPGNGTPGTSMTIAGNLAFATGALYLVNVNRTTSSFATVTGTASLGGGTVQAMVSGFPNKSYDILHATGGLGGTSFGGVSVNNFNASLSYTATDVFLTLSPALGAGTALNQNQQNVATALNNFFNTGGALPQTFLNLFGLTGGALANTLTQLDGEAATGAERGAFQLTNEFLSLMLDPFVYGRAGGFGGGGGAIGFAPEQEANLPPDIALAYASILHQGAAADLRAALDRVGFGLWRRQQCQRRSGGRLDQRHARAPSASPPAWTITSRRTPSSALRSPAAASIGDWRTRSAAAGATPCRPASIASAISARLISPARSPSPITGSTPAARRWAISSPRTLSAKAMARGWKAAIASVYCRRSA